MLYQTAKPLLVYKNQICPLPKGEKGTKQVIYSIGSSDRSLLRLLENKVLLWKMARYRYYYIDYMYLAKIGSKRIRKNQRKSYTNRFQEEPNGTRLRQLPPAGLAINVRSKEPNVFVDLGEWNSLWFTHQRMDSRAKICDRYLEFLTQHMHLDEFSSYEKCFLVDLADWVSLGDKTINLTKKGLTNPLSIFLCCAYYFPEKLEVIQALGSPMLLLIDSLDHSFMKIPFDQFTKEHFQRIRNRLNQMVGQIDLGEEELEEEKKEEASSTPSPSTRIPLRKAVTPLPKKTILPKGSIPFQKASPVAKKETTAPTKGTLRNIESEELTDTQLDHVLQARERIQSSLSKNVLGDPNEDEMGVDLDETPVEAPPDDLDLEDIGIDSSEEAELEKELFADEKSLEEDEEIDDIEAEVFEEEPDEDVPAPVKVEKEKSRAERDAIKVNYTMKFHPERDAKTEKRIVELKQTQEKVIGVPTYAREDRSRAIPHTDLSSYVKTTNPEIVKSSYINMDHTYVKNYLDKDIHDAVGALANATSKVFITGVQETDSSNQADLKKTVIYSLQDEHGKKMKLKLDIPIVIDGNYLYLNGGKKLLTHQLMLNPLVKTGPATVQFVGNYNKMMILRHKDKDYGVINFLKFFGKNAERFRVKIGNASVENKDISTPLSFDSLAKRYYSFEIGTHVFVMDLPRLAQTLHQKNLIHGTDMIVGYEKGSKTPIVFHSDHDDFIDFVISFLPEKDQKALRSASTQQKNVMYTEVLIMMKKIPLILLLCYCEGFEEIMKRAEVEYHFIKKEERSQYPSWEYGLIELDGSYIAWKRFPLEKSLLMNGFYTMDLTMLTPEMLEDKETWISLMGVFYESAAMSQNLDQFKDFMIDSITKDLLIEHHLPTTFVEVLLKANSMLTTNYHIPEMDDRNRRVRSSELIAACTYKVVTKAYNEYRKTLHKKNPKSLSVNQNAVIQMVKKSSLLDESSFLNPALEMEKKRAVTYKGEQGIGKSRAMTLEKRAYNESMLGVLGISTSPDANVGVVRQMTLEPNVTSVRGTLGVTDMAEIDDLTSAQLLTPAEMLTPMGVLHDDPTRTAMAYKQTKYMVSVDDSEPVFIGNKVEAIIPHHLGNDFVSVAKRDGKVLTETQDFLILQYEDGTNEAIDVSAQIKKNSSGGFHVPSQKITDLKVGDFFKKGDVLAYEKRAFSKESLDGDVSMNLGVLIKVAICSNWDVYEDSGFASEEFSKRMETSLISESKIALAKGAYVEKIAKVGDQVRTGDVLMTFENQPENEEAVKLLRTFQETLKEELIESTISTIRSKHTGVIDDIRIYTTVPVEELSPSLQAIIIPYHKRIQKRNAVLKKYKNKGDYDFYSCGTLIQESPEPMEPDYQGRIFGVVVGEGVLIQFYVKYQDQIGKGDKFVDEFALKVTTSHVVEQTYTPYSEYRPEEEISTFIAPLAVTARKVPTIFIAMFGNKILLERKRQLCEEYLGIEPHK